MLMLRYYLDVLIIILNSVTCLMLILATGVINLRTGTRLSIKGNLSLTTAMILRKCGGSYTKS